MGIVLNTEIHCLDKRLVSWKLGNQWTLNISYMPYVANNCTEIYRIYYAAAVF